MRQSQTERVPDVPRFSRAALNPLLTDYVMHYGRLYGRVVFYHHFFFPPHRLSLQRVTRLPYLDHSDKLTRYFLCSQTSIGGHTNPERILKNVLYILSMDDGCCRGKSHVQKYQQSETKPTHFSTPSSSSSS